jgi:hypothetical protein
MDLFFKGCGMTGHWTRDGPCKAEDVAAKVARDYAADLIEKSSQQAAGGQGQAVRLPGMIYKCYLKGVLCNSKCYFFLLGHWRIYSWQFSKRVAIFSG